MDRIAQILAQQGGINPVQLGQLNTVSNPMTAPMQDVTPFQWGAGGRRLSQDDIDRQRQQASALMKSNYSPVSNWAQGLGRVADNVMGAIDSKQADKDAMAYQAQQAGDLSAAGISPQIAQLLLNPTTAGVGEAAYKSTLPKQAPVNDTVADYNFWKGQLAPEDFQAYVANKINPPHFGSLPDGTFGMIGGYVPQPKGGDPSSGPVTKTVNGVTAYFVNGDWYDNPEGR